MKVIIIGKIGKVELEKIVEMGYEVEVVSVSEMKKGNYNRDAEIVCGSIYMKGLKIEEFKNLKYIFLTSMGFEHLPLDYVIEKNIVVSNNGGAYSEPMGEWIVFNLLELVKKAKINILNQRELYWEKKLICGNLYGKKVLFLGTGSIAKEGAKRLKGFNMEIVGFNTKGRDEDYFDYCVDENGVDEELAKADFIVVTLPSTESTYGFLNEEKFKKVKDGAALANVSRGSVIDEEALVKALKNGKLSGAALDVFEVEPLPKENPLWEMENVYITPHISYTSEDMDSRVMRTVILNLKNLKEKRPLINVVDFKKGY